MRFFNLALVTGTLLFSGTSIAGDCNEFNGHWKGTCTYEDITLESEIRIATDSCHNLWIDNESYQLGRPNFKVKNGYDSSNFVIEKINYVEEEKAFYSSMISANLNPEFDSRYETNDVFVGKVKGWIADGQLKSTEKFVVIGLDGKEPDAGTVREGKSCSYQRIGDY